jgi:hypothetical protein
VKKAKGHESYSAAEEIVGKSVRNPTKNAADVKKRGKAFYENATETHMPFSENLSDCIEKDGSSLFRGTTYYQETSCIYRQNPGRNSRSL